MATGIRINVAKNFAGELYATQKWTQEWVLGKSYIAELLAGNGIAVNGNEIALSIAEASKLTTAQDTQVALYGFNDEGKFQIGDVQAAIDYAVATAAATVDARFGTMAEGKIATATADGKLAYNYGVATAVAESSTDADLPTAKAVFDAINKVSADAIGVSEGEGIKITASGTNNEIALKLDGNDKILSIGENGLEATIGLGVREGEGNVSKQYFLTDKNGNQLGETVIDIYKDQFLKNATYDPATKKLTFVFNVEDGTSIAEIDLAGLVDVYTASKGIVKVGSDFQGVVDGNSEKVTTAEGTTEDVLSVGENGFKVGNVQKAIDYACGVAEANASADAAAQVKAGNNAVIDKVNTALTNAVQVLSSTVALSTAEGVTSGSVNGLVIAVFDNGKQVYPEIAYADGVSTLSAEYGEASVPANWTVIHTAAISSIEKFA